MAGRAIQPPRPRSLGSSLDAGASCVPAYEPTRRQRGRLRLRSGFQFDASIPWEAISTIRHRRSSAHRKLQIKHNQTGASLALQGATNVEVVFREPVLVRFLDGRQANVDAIHFSADSPTALLTAARAHLARIPAAA